MGNFFKTQGQEFLDVANLLSSKGYEELPSLVVDDSDIEPPIILVDKENKNYLQLCTEGTRRMEEFIQKCIKQEVKIVTLKEVQSWHTN